MKIFSINNIYKKILAYILIISFTLFFNIPLKNTIAQDDELFAGEREKTESVLISQNIVYLSPNSIFEIDDTLKQDKSQIIISDNSFSIPNKVVIDFKNPKDENSTNSDGKIKYKAKKGDTLEKIAKKFNITISTIKVENGLTNNTVRNGQEFNILPTSGFTYSIRSGDSLQKIAKRYDSSEDEIELYNVFSNDKKLKKGREIIIPVKNYYKKISKPVVVRNNTKKTQKKRTSRNTNPKKKIQDKRAQARRIISSGRGYFTNPAPGSVRTQGIHGRNAVDLASKGGRHIPIVAAASGKVTRARRVKGYYGGYGMNIKVAHSNGTVTLYAHLSRVIVHEGQYVKKGQVIGYMGNTGRSTGVHLHFEVRNGRNPF